MCLVRLDAELAAPASNALRTVLAIRSADRPASGFRPSRLAQSSLKAHTVQAQALMDIEAQIRLYGIASEFVK